MDAQASFKKKAARLKEACAEGVHLRILDTDDHTRRWAESRALILVHRETGRGVRLASTQVARLSGHDFWLVYVKEA